MTDRAGDAPRVVRVDDATWRTYRDVRLAMLRDAPRAFWTTYAEAAARSDEEWRSMVGRSHTWLALDGDRPVGSAARVHLPDQPGDECVLVGMWVDPVARGRRVGELLVRTVLESAREAGVRRVLLDVAHENAPARRLYERMGFSVTGRTGEMPHDPSITELEMELVLSADTVRSW